MDESFVNNSMSVLDEAAKLARKDNARCI